MLNFAWDYSITGNRGPRRLSNKQYELLAVRLFAKVTGDIFLRIHSPSFYGKYKLLLSGIQQSDISLRRVGEVEFLLLHMKGTYCWKFLFSKLLINSYMLIRAENVVSSIDGALCCCLLSCSNIGRGDWIHDVAQVGMWILSSWWENVL